MIDGAAEVLEQPTTIATTKEQIIKEKVPQEFSAMREFCAAVQKQQENSGEAMSRKQVEGLFNLQWMRDHVGQDNIKDPEDGWYRERIDSVSSTVQIHIQPEGLAVDQGDMMVHYTDIQGNKGEDAVQEQFQLDSTIPGSPCRRIMLNFLPGNKYQFRIWIPGEDGEQVIRGTSQEDATGETTWGFE